MTTDTLAKLDSTTVNFETASYSVATNGWTEHAAPEHITDHEIETLAHRMCWRYKHDGCAIGGPVYTFNRVTLLDFARKLTQSTPAPSEPFGYFKAEPFGWTDCAETDDGAVALYERPQQAAQPEFTPIAKRKLAELEAQGYLINGYSLIHKEKLARGFIDSYGFVGWWSSRDHEAARLEVAEDKARLYERLRKFSPREFQSLWTKNVTSGAMFDDLVRAAIASEATK